MDAGKAKRFILEHGTARERAQGLWVLERRPPDPAVVRAFLSEQRPNGGFGGVGATITALTHYDSLGLGDPGLDGACEAAQTAAAALARVHAFLLSRQRPDGDWDEDPHDLGPNPPPWETPGDPKARAYLTAAACLELARPDAGAAPAREVADRNLQAVVRGLRYLLARRAPNDRFEGFWHTTWLAASALAAVEGPGHPAAAVGLDALAAHPIEVWEASQMAWMLLSFRRGGIPADRPPIPALVAHLEASQLPDGSWASEDGRGYAVFATVESLRALRAYGRG